MNDQEINVPSFTQSITSPNKSVLGWTRKFAASEGYLTKVKNSKMETIIKSRKEEGIVSADVKKSETHRWSQRMPHASIYRYLRHVWSKLKVVNGANHVHDTREASRHSYKVESTLHLKNGLTIYVQTAVHDKSRSYLKIMNRKTLVPRDWSSYNQLIRVQTEPPYALITRAFSSSPCALGKGSRETKATQARLAKGGSLEPTSTTERTKNSSTSVKKAKWLQVTVNDRLANHVNIESKYTNLTKIISDPIFLALCYKFLFYKHKIKNEIQGKSGNMTEESIKNETMDGVSWTWFTKLSEEIRKAKYKFPVLGALLWIRFGC